MAETREKPFRGHDLTLEKRKGPVVGEGHVWGEGPVGEGHVQFASLSCVFSLLCEFKSVVPV